MKITHKILGIAITRKFWFKCAVTTASMITTEKQRQDSIEGASKRGDENDGNNNTDLPQSIYLYVVPFTATKPFKTGQADNVYCAHIAHRHMEAHDKILLVPTILLLYWFHKAASLYTMHIISYICLCTEPTNLKPTTSSAPHIPAL